jgi:hypothetical protein
MRHNGNREKEAIEDYTTKEKEKEQKDGFILLGDHILFFCGLTSVHV